MKFKTRFTKLGEFYKAMDVLIEWLKKNGYLDASPKLSTAMTAGAIGSEILGDIVLVLKFQAVSHAQHKHAQYNVHHHQ